MTDSLKEQAIKQLQKKHEAEAKRAEQKAQDKGAFDAIKASNARIQEKQKSNIPHYDVDKLQLYLGEPFSLNDKITIRQPTVGDLIRLGEKDVYSVVHIFTANTTSYRLILWDMGIDWCKITDYDLFQLLCPTLSQSSTEFLFGDIDFSKLQRYKKVINEEETVVLYDPEQDIEIDQSTYEKLAWYVRNMFNIFPKNEFAKGKSTKESIIEEDRLNFERHKKEEYQSTLLPLISSCLNHPGFKYSKKELMNVGIVEFMDSVQRLQIYESSTALLKGAYSGFMDTSKIDSKQFDFMRDIGSK